MATNMLRNVSFSLHNVLRRCSLFVSDILGNRGLGFEPALAPALNSIEPLPSSHGQRNGSSLEELFDGFLWAVPKHRRSIQRNRMRRRADDKRMVYNRSLVPCETCGTLRQVGYLCGHCLVRIREETKQIQDQMFEELDQDEILPDKETVVLYQGETLTEADTNKRPVEIKKKRPAWFSRDLLNDWRKW